MDVKPYHQSDIFERIEHYNALLGCIKINNEYNFYLMPVAWWILNYKKYDPAHSTHANFDFRNNIYTVTDSNIGNFIQSISADKISAAELQQITNTYKNTNEQYYSYLSFYIDFDKKLYVNGFYNIELEKYLPEKWKGKSGNPTNYLPRNLFVLFEQ